MTSFTAAVTQNHNL